MDNVVKHWISQLKDKEQTLVFNQQECQQLKSDIGTLKRRIKMANTELQVSDHAIVQYLTRKLELDMTNIKDEILTDTIRAYADKAGKTGKFTLDGMTRVLQDGVVVTIY